MVGQTISHYKILEKLGEGGMGIVYKAHDLDLERTVALKFLPDRVRTDDNERMRFLQEARAASALNHPHICTVYNIEESEGHKFIVMEYVDGTTLRAKVPVQKLQDALAYAIQAGDALHEAHLKGIVHRDVKSENIMVNGRNQIKVMDFGLAKLKGSLKLTRTSSTVGTLAYMAPEQIQGGEVDARSDIFSFGIVVFEMLMGQTPFRGEHEAAMMYSIMNEEPASLRTYRPELPEDLDRIIRRAIEKDPEDRYQHIDDMVSELRRMQKQSTRVVRPAADSKPVEQLPQKAPVRFHFNRTSRRTAGIVAAVLVVGILAGAYFIFRGGSSAGHGGSARMMMVVLPFENMGPPNRDYFVDGITEEITSKLSGLSGLGVIARSSALQYQKTDKAVKQIGNELGVNYILQGTVRWDTSGGSTQVRVIPRLIKVDDGTQVWSEPAEATLSSAFKLQSEIASRVASALNLAILQPERRSLESKPTENSVAYDYYLRGMSYYNRNYGKDDMDAAVDLFNLAVGTDPSFVLAYCRLASVHANCYWEYYDRTEARVQLALTAARKAMELDPNLAESHAALAWYYYHGRLEYDSALTEFHKALEIGPSTSDVYLGIGSIYRRQGKFNDAYEAFSKALEMDPRSLVVLLESGFTAILVHRYDVADDLLNRLLAIAPDHAEAYFEKVLIALNDHGDLVKARQIVQQAEAKNVRMENSESGLLLVTLALYERHYDNAIAISSRLSHTSWDSQYDFSPPQLVRGRIYDCMGNRALARASYDSAKTVIAREIQKSPDDSRLYGALGIAEAGLGDAQHAIGHGQKAISMMPIEREALRGPHRVTDMALIYAKLGVKEKALEQLEIASKHPTLLGITPHTLRLDPEWDNIRAEPRFQKLLAEK